MQGGTEDDRAAWTRARRTAMAGSRTPLGAVATLRAILGTASAQSNPGRKTTGGRLKAGVRCARVWTRDTAHQRSAPADTPPRYPEAGVSMTRTRLILAPFCPVLLHALFFSGLCFAQPEGALLWRASPLAQISLFGDAVDAIGDINGDGYSDVIVGASQAVVQNLNVGQAFVLSGLDGSVIFTLNGENRGDGFGWSVAGIGDINKDGVPDFAVGASCVDIGNFTDAGCVYFYSGKDASRIGSVARTAQDNRLGYAVNGAGDVNRDAYPDIIAGAVGYLAYALLISGRDLSILKRIDNHQTNGGTAFAEDVTGIGDVDKDGYDDVAIGAHFGHSPTVDWVGCVFIYSGKTYGLAKSLCATGGLGRFGNAVSGAGDVNGDTYPDFIVGEMTGGPGRVGQAHVISGKDYSFIYTFKGTGQNGMDYFGFSVDSGMDLNGDGVPDFVVGARSVNAPGYVMVFSGKDGKAIAKLQTKNTGRYACSVAVAGHLDGDRVADIIIGESLVNPESVFAHSVFPPAQVSLSSNPRIGSTINMGVESPADGGLSYVAGLSLGTIPGILLPDRRTVGLNPDWLLSYTTMAVNPHFRPAVGVLDAAGKASISLTIPNEPALLNQTVYGGFVVLTASARSGVRRISKALPITFE